MAANIPIRSRDIQASFPRSLSLEARIEAERIGKDFKVDLKSETLRKIHQQMEEIFRSIKEDPNLQKFSSKENLVKQCFRNVWTGELSEKVLSSVSWLRYDIDYCLVQDRFDEGLNCVKFEVEEYFNEVLDDKALMVYKDIQLSFNIKEVVDKSSSFSKIRDLKAIKWLFSKKT